MAKFNDFKSYIQANYRELLEKAVMDYIEVPHDGYGSYSFSMMSICRQHVENLEIKTLCCHNDIGPLVKIDVNLTVEIVTNGLGTRRYDVDRRRKWYTVFLSARLCNGMHDVKVLDTKEYYGTTFDKEDAMDEYLVPYIHADQFEEMGDDFYEFYWEPVAAHQDGFPYMHILNEMGINAYKAPLPDNVFGRMYFRPANVQHYYKYYPTVPNDILVEEEIPAGTMLINSNHFFMSDIGGTYNTMAHEMVHWEHHQKFFEILALLDQDNNQLSCEVAPVISPSELTGAKRAVWWAEWQANCLASRYQMPRILFMEIFNDVYAEKCEFDFHDPGQVMEDTIIAVAEKFGVSKYAAKTRAIQLGYDDADPTFLFVNGQYFPPLSFKRGSLGKNETYIIDKDSLRKQLIADKSLAGLLESELFVYAGCTVCINDSLYVELETHPYRTTEYSLTEYGKYHLDECCLKFRRTFINRQGFDYEFYGQCFLSREVKASAYCETTKVDEDDKQDKKQKAIELQKLKQEGNRVMGILRDLPNSFSGTLRAHMKRIKMINPHTGKPVKITQLELASRTGLSEDYIGQLCKDPKGVSLETVCAICIALHLHPVFSIDLIEKSKNDFSDDAEGFLGRYIIERHFTESLSVCNEMLVSQGFKPWGKIKAE